MLLGFTRAQTLMTAHASALQRGCNQHTLVQQLVSQIKDVYLLGQRQPPTPVMGD